MTSRVSTAAAFAAAFIALWSAPGSETHAQDVTPSPPPVSDAPAVTEQGPRPYSSLRPRRVRPAARATQAPKPPVAATTAPETPSVAAAAPIAAGVAPLPRQELEAFVDGVVQRAMARDHIAGVTISVVQNGQVVLKKGYGFANLGQRRPVDPDKTLFRIASISKTFTWIALMNEIESGHMRLDGPVNLYLPEPLQLKDQGKKTQVRLRDLMTHTAGFEDRAMGQLFERDPNRIRPLADYLRQERPRRVREPGLLPSYSNYGAALAGAAVANVTGKPFEQLVSEEIILPTGMRHTTFREARPWRDNLPAPMSEDLAAELSDGFSWTPLGWTVRPREFIGQVAPAGSASSTAGDMARYMTLLLNGGAIDGKTVFSPKAAQAFRAPMYRPAPEAAGWNAGFQDIPLPGGRRGFGHAGATLYFHSNMVVAPDLGLGVFISVNTDSGANLPATLPATIIEHFYAKPPAVPPPSAMSYEQAKLYEGDYLTTRRAYGGLEGFINRVVGRASVRATPEGRLSISEGGSTALFNAAGRPGVFKAVEGPLVIVFDANGDRPSRFYAARGFATYERVSPLRSARLLIVIAALAGLASLATVLGTIVRNRREARQTPVQARASQMQTAQAVLWLISSVCMGVFAVRSSDQTAAFFGWPSGWLLSGSACALVAALMAVVTLGALPMVWRGGRRVDSWTAGRKVAFTFTALLFVFLSVLLGLWGYLLPWS
ncbi:serine hydrolase domain-containing protein [Caulobacter segnis]|uniref:serine hydrolase domain-containing protein n=1 Tax=Caulobacter segnis TaxID=88688 RepID=UPI00285B25C8|nr:serine hydrolase domain-containing protein [Caulobacter segnis]MDR6627198.1 CubicO group peptidase (beta-lactamase class C family) [Caulobacter segnis]